jgi:hypothetical protein
MDEPTTNCTMAVSVVSRDAISCACAPGRY